MAVRTHFGESRSAVQQPQAIAVRAFKYIVFALMHDMIAQLHVHQAME